MSHLLGRIVGRRKDRDIQVSSHSAGAGGQCMQFSQGTPVSNVSIEMDKCQVVEAIEKMQAWLDRS